MSKLYIIFLISIIFIIIGLVIFFNYKKDEFFLKNNKKAICILCIKFEDDFHGKLAKHIDHNEYDIFIVEDNDPNKFSNKIYNNNINILSIPRNDCQKDGFYGSVSYTKSRACSRDKALWYFYKKNHYDHVWFLEDDVFIPNNQTIPNIDKKISNYDDLVIPYINTYKHDKQWLHWKKLHSQLTDKSIHGLVCSCRMSKKMLYALKKYSDIYGNIGFCELFPEVARLYNLKISTPKELSKIWAGAGPKSTHNILKNVENINPKYLYHPQNDKNLYIKLIN